MSDQPVTVRLSESQIKRLDASGKSRSQTLRDLLDSSATVWVQDQTPVASTSEYQLVPADLAPESDAMRKFELYMGASQAGIRLDGPRLVDFSSTPELGNQLLEAALNDEHKRQSLLASYDPKSMMSGPGSGINFPLSIDPVIRAMMQISEFYIMEGDVWQSIMVPLEVGFQDFDFPTGDKGAKREARQFLETEIDGHELIESLWLARRVYGQAYPIKVRDNGRLTAVLVPNSKHIAVGRTPGLTSNTYAYVPSSLTTAEALYNAQPSFLYTTSEWAWNEVDVQIRGLPINPADIAHIKEPKFQHNYYAIPPLARATRSLDSRRFLEEMQRATIEGVKNQLWLFKLENPKPGEAKLLADTLAGARGSRTGYLVWGSNLSVEQFVPGAIDELLAPEAMWNYTMRVYRALGISIRMISGESPTGTGASNVITDVDIALDRMIYSRKPLERYLQTIVDDVVGLKDGDARTKIRLADVELKIAETIKNKVAPLMNYGLLSPTSAFTLSGLDAESQWEQLKSDDADRKKYIYSYSSFSQDGPSGRTASVSTGRPSGKAETQPRQEANATLVVAGVQDEYQAAIAAAFLVLQDAWNSDPDTRRDAVERFIAAMLLAGNQYRDTAYRSGYFDNGGPEPIDEADMERWRTWDLANLNNFADELLARAASGLEIDALESRALMYASQGYRMAYIGGVMAAKRRRGFMAWRRLLRPYASHSGPCAICKADARIVHDISEPFFDHPAGVCGMQYLAFYMTPQAIGDVVKVPVSEAA